ncbi:sigma factor-like helix-turn-helix DNA-binding protein [Thiomicrospira microaerophila]|uniref:sigma factor-like helix-turn-helix DNA-binding protein n=1 Tax=Thiomicrospira microaerophila TaxID=406020 RepID=UPI0005C916D6|nr:sigma factor-like helix-turn-helix DNA-binding protein [Thiomicrospira microaerophila]
MQSKSFSDYSELCHFVKKFGVEVDHNFEKVIKKIFALVDSSVLPIKTVTIDSILEIPPLDLTKIKGVGLGYAGLLEDVQKKLTNKTFEPFDVISASQKICFSKKLIEDLRFSYKGLNQQEIKYLKNLINDIGNLDLIDIIELDIDLLEQQKGYGKNKIHIITELKEKFFNELFRVAVLGGNFNYGQSDLIVSVQSSFYSDVDLEEVIIEDIEDFVFELPENECDIFLSRLGFNHQVLTLEALGQKYGVTRERIRQIDKGVFNQFVKEFTIPLELIKDQILYKTEDKFLTMPTLYSLFEKEQSFYSFFARLLQSNSEFDIDEFKPLSNLSLFDEFVTENKSPFEKEHLINELVSSTGLNFIKASITLDFLTDKGVFTQDLEGKYLPSRLGKKEALAHTLLNFPNGLPWKDAALFTNSKGYSRNNIYTDRLDGSFNTSENIYQSGSGTYKHLIFSCLNDVDLDQVILDAKNFLETLPNNSCHLNEFFQIYHNKTHLGYFELRYILREYGELHGVFFRGKSNQDSISLNEGVSLGGQRELIINLLNQAEGPLSKAEIAQKIRSQSLRHATFYLFELMNEKKVIRVENMQYSTPEKMFKNINIDNLLIQIKDLVTSVTKPVEADVLRQKLNVKNSLSYSKYFYLSLADIYIDSIGLFRVKGFLSSTPIEFNGLSGLTSLVCDRTLSFRENVDIVKDKVLITQTVAESAVSQFYYVNQ